MRTEAFQSLSWALRHRNRLPIDVKRLPDKSVNREPVGHEAARIEPAAEGPYPRRLDGGGIGPHAAHFDAPEARSFFAYASTSFHVFGGFSGSSPAFLKASLL